MTAKPAVYEIRLSRVLLLLAISVFINYLDRGNLSIAAPLLKNEFQLSATQLGVLLSSFFWTYSFFLPVSGWLADRPDVKWVIAGGFCSWWALLACCGYCHGCAGCQTAIGIPPRNRGSPRPACCRFWSSGQHGERVQVSSV